MGQTNVKRFPIRGGNSGRGVCMCHPCRGLGDMMRLKPPPAPPGPAAFWRPSQTPNGGERAFRGAEFHLATHLLFR
jgi:hypothetical protein